MHREQPTVDTVFDRVSVPSPEGGVTDFETSRGTLAVIFTFRMDTGLWISLWVKYGCVDVFYLFFMYSSLSVFL